MDVLVKLFGPIRLKILRFFLQHPEGVYEDKEIAKRLKIKLRAARKELKNLETVGLAKNRTAFITPVSTKSRKRKFKGWYFHYLPVANNLKKLIFSAVPFKNDEIVKRLRGAGRISVLIVSGVFIQSDDSPIDILIVGDRLKRGAAEAVLRSMEAEIGRELNYAIFESNDFLYRLEAYDKFIREVLEHPHHKIIDRLGIKYPA